MNTLIKLIPMSKDFLQNICIVLDWCFYFMLAVGIGLCFNLPTVPSEPYKNFATALVFIGFLNVVCRFKILLLITKNN